METITLVLHQRLGDEEFLAADIGVEGAGSARVRGKDRHRREHQALRQYKIPVAVGGRELHLDWRKRMDRQSCQS